VSELDVELRWSGGMKESAILVTPDNAIYRLADFTRHIRHVSGGYEQYRARFETGDMVLKLYVSGSGRSESVTVISPPGGKTWRSFDEAERELGLAEGSIQAAMWG